MRASGTRQQQAYHWCAVGYRESSAMARWNSRSAAAQFQSCVDFTCASDVWASTEYSS